MKKYQISFGTGTYYLQTKEVQVEDYECEQDAVDLMIDTMEEEYGISGNLYTYDDMKTLELIDRTDEYVIGGNHCLYLMHYGNFNIKEI